MSVPPAAAAEVAVALGRARGPALSLRPERPGGPHGDRSTRCRPWLTAKAKVRSRCRPLRHKRSGCREEEGLTGLSARKPHLQPAQASVPTELRAPR
ncbi:hypothetical protein MTO96_035650 [Rhipicephalus appendiculatus]